MRNFQVACAQKFQTKNDFYIYIFVIFTERPLGISLQISCSN